MILNYLKIAWRNLLKNKIFSLINITGLSIGITACILISVYILHESSYDKQVPNGQNVYRLTSSIVIDGKTQWDISFSANTAPTIKTDFEEVIATGRLMDNNLFYGAGTNEIRFDNDPMQHHEEGFTYADQSIIDILGIKMVNGDSKTALAKPNTIVISKKIANKYFKGQNPVGKSMYLNGRNDQVFTINGVMENFASTSHLKYDFLITLKGVEFGEGEQTRWVQSNYTTYLLLKPGIDLTQFNKKLSFVIIVKYLKPALKDVGFALWANLEKIAKLELQPLAAINLYSNHINGESSLRNDYKIIWIFGIVALFILVIASINFINLSTAKSANRAKEVGLRKVAGSTRANLIAQFLTESILVTFISFGVGLLLATLLMPYFSTMSGKVLSLPFQNPLFLPTIIFTAVLIGVLAGIYPSLYLSGFNPINVLKGKLRMGSKSGGLRSSLVVFQFTISVILIVGTIIVNQQLNFILNSKIGFEKDQVIQLYGTHMLGDKVRTFKEELKKIPGVSSVSISDFLPIEGTKRNGNTFENEGRQGQDQPVPGQSWDVDDDYLTTLGIKLLAGRNFKKELAIDDKAVIINQEMAKRLNLKQPVGKRISRYGQLWEIIGVVQDFNFDSMREKVRPLALFRGISPSVISLKVNTKDMAAVLASMKTKWAAFAPNYEYRYAFMDDTFTKMYENVSRIKAIFTSFAILAIFVACLGLFALSAFLVEQRSKEMSIRKVLGASVGSIFRLLTNNFLVLILISLVIAFPVAYYLMKNWLNDYEYRINIGWSVFAISGAISIAIALFTISYQALKAAVANPIESLKTE
ncbi:MAG: ABC transporter permease [Bacteroidota bacterium]